MKRVTIIFALLVVPFVLFAGGQGEGSGEQSRETPEEEITLDVWSWRGEDVEEYKRIFDVFEEANPGITVDFRTIKNTEYNTVLATALEGDQGPDVMQLRAYGGLQRYIDFLMPLDDVVPELENFPNSSIASASGRKDGKIYGVPFANQALGIYYNKRIFEENGVAPPSTWSEFIDLLDTLKSNGVTPLANGGQAAWMLEIMFGTIAPNFYGGNDFYEAVVAGETTFTDERFINALERMYNLRDYMPNGFMGMDFATMQANFFTEQAAMYIGGSFEAAFFQQQNPDLDIGVFPAPRPEGTNTNYIGVWADGSYGVNRSTPHEEAALKLIQFMASKEFGDMFTNMLAQISPIPGVEADPSKVPVLSKFISFLDEYETTPYIMLVGFRWDQPTGSVVLQNALQGMMQGDMSPQEVAETVHTELASWYEPFQN
ncbi:MAG TPA: extracellular solute-binding protein [Sediminispirochaeta sp.]|nr:extracellular solute-binding protein [Sediminispirochaeta sp.]